MLKLLKESQPLFAIVASAFFSVVGLPLYLYHTFRIPDYLFSTIISELSLSQLPLLLRSLQGSDFSNNHDLKLFKQRSYKGCAGRAQ